MRGKVVFVEGESARWLYSAGQRRLLRSPAEIIELKQKKLLEQEEVALSKAVLEAIPIMPGSATP